MDFLLRFKSLVHNQTFSETLSLRLKSRCYLGVAVIAGYIVLLINDALTNSESKANHIWDFSRRSLLIVWILVMQYFCRKTIKLIRYATIIQVLLDLIIVFLASTDYAWTIIKDGDPVGPADIRGGKLIGWDNGVLFSCSLLLINSWYLRILACIIKFVIFATLMLTASDVLDWHVGILAVVLLVQAYAVYNRERFDRNRHIDSIKIFQDSQAVLKILDDITEGILIIDEFKNILYMNSPVKKIFQTDNPRLTQLFANVSVKSVSSVNNSCNISYTVNWFIMKCLSSRFFLIREIRWTSIMKRFHRFCLMFPAISANASH